MKQLILTLAILCMLAHGFAVGSVKLSDTNNSINVVSSGENETILQYRISHFDRERVTIGGKEWFHINLPGEGISQDKGFPQLPVFNRSIIIGNSALMKLDVYDVEYTDIEMPIAPSKGVITRDIDPATVPYTFGKVYSGEEFYPAKIASLSEPYIMRDFRGITVQTAPFAYNPQTRTLRVFTSYKIRVFADGIDMLNTLSTARTSISRAFLPIYENHFINYQSYRYVPVNDSFGKLLVVCHLNFLTQIAPYVNWKKQKGIETELVEWSTIGTTAAHLQTYIQNRYNADNTLTYIQLVGDAPQIPSLSSGGGGSDPTFSLVAGGDNYPDIFIGRFSAETTAEVTAQVNKAIVYERDLNSSATWLSQAMGIASSEGGGGIGDNDESDIQHMNIIRTKLLNYGYGIVDQIYDPGALAATITTNVNTGRGFINYVGHGDNTFWVTTGFNNTNATNLTNGNKTPVIMDVACVNGNFVSLTCFAEAWLRNANGGAVTMYASTINQSWNSPMRAQDEFTDLITTEQKFTTGGLYFNSSCKMMDIYGNTTGSDGVNMFKTWTIFGDASLLMRSKTPLAMTVTHPASIAIGTSTVNVSTGVANALVSITYTNTIYARGYTNGSGNATLNLINAPQTALNYTITATAFNRVTYIGTIQQVAGTGPLMVVHANTYADSNNNVAEYNEAGAFNVTFQNSGASTASNITANLTCSTTGISVTDNTESIASLAAGASVTRTNAYTFNIANNIAHGTSAQFTITMVSGADTWVHNFALAINAPALAFGTMIIFDPTPANNNGRLDPGETVSVTILLNNTGGAASPSGSATLSSLTTGISISGSPATFGSIAATGSVNPSFTVSAAAGMTVGTLATFNFNATAGAYTASKSETTTVGQIPQAIIGTGTTVSGTSEGAPINIYYKSLHGQAVYTAAELNAAGVFGPINITQIGFYVASVPNLALPNFTIRMKHTAEANVANWQTATNLSTVYTNTSYMPVAGGFEMLNLSTPFLWNGTGNIVVDTAFDLVSTWSTIGTVRYTSVTNGYRYVRSDTANQGNIFTGGTLTAFRPNLKLTFQAQQSPEPAIAVNPASFTETVNSGASVNRNLTITNTGSAALNWSVQGREVLVSERDDVLSTQASDDLRPSTWLSVSPLSGTIAAGGNTVLTVTLNSSGLAVGIYNDSIVINSNAVNNPSLSVPVSLTVFNPYPVNPRYVAEWEPAKGAVIRYPFGLPYSMMRDIAVDNLLYVVVTSANQSTCNSLLTSNSVNMANVRYINAASDSYWIRDYGPWYIFENGNDLRIVDFTYNRPRPNDNVVPVAIANYLGLQYYTMPIVHTGGNIMSSGMGKAMSTRLVLEENTSLTQNQINTMFNNYLGVSDYQLYEDPNNTYIDHIDCWGKLLDVDKVIIRSVPTTHAQYTAIEAVVAQWQSTTTSYGTPYRIYRVYTPNNEPYSNAFILNKNIFVPQMGTANDAAALQSYRNAMPGYTVTGYTHTNFEATDAIHCRVNSIFDEQMVVLNHVPPTSATAGEGIAISVNIRYQNPLNPASTFVAWRHSPTTEWQYASLTNPSGSIWNASIPAPALGQTIYYWIKATDNTGRNSTLPLCAGNDPFSILVNIPGINNAPVIGLPPSFAFDMNGELTVDFSAYVSDVDGDPLILSYSGNSNIYVSVNGLSVTFSGASDWIGTELITFIVSDGTDYAQASVPATVNLTFLSAPDIQVSENAGIVSLTWNAVNHAQSYRIYGSNSTNGNFILIGSTNELFWSEPAAENRFYKVVATDQAR
ncbi:MAG: C25 family cysteine peptidase [Candidatus Cloacimonadaceae bacterium]|nr:C25 family cysteine peptidase [Candidatus Cloacimonadaceae bacterium]